MKRTRVFATYLPQFHETPENNSFWGEGFTDWTNVKESTPLFPGHNQPRIPYNSNYYDLTDVSTIKWQASLAREYGIDGFSIYHYWFKDGKRVLEKPLELLRDHREIDISYFLTWDNCSWVRTWGDCSGNAWAPISDKEKNGPSILLKMEYGDKAQWKEHFMYLMEFFKDDRYLKIDGKPVFAFMTEIDRCKLIKMCEYWRQLAEEYGLPGLYLISSHRVVSKNFLDASFVYEPKYSAWGRRAGIERRLKMYFGLDCLAKKRVRYEYSYDLVWKRIIRYARMNRKKSILPGAFVMYDDSPRRGNNAAIITDSSPQKFYQFFKELYEICCKKDKELIFLTAWNEWGEGAYLEPDSQNQYGYLEALGKALADIGSHYHWTEGR